MIYYILAIISLLIFIALVIIFRHQVLFNRNKKLDYSEFHHYYVTNFVIDYLAFRIVHFCQMAIRKFYLFSLHFIKNSVATARYTIIKIERHFNRIVDSAPGPDEIYRTDKVSSFLKEITEHKETAMIDFKKEASDAQRDIIEN